MKKRNRQRKTYHLKLSQLGSVFLMAMLIVPWILPISVDLQNEQTTKKIKELEYTKRALEDSLRRQTADWNRLIQPDNLDEAVQKNGFSLSYAPPERSIIVHQNGKMEIPAALLSQTGTTAIAKRGATRGERVAVTTSQKRTTRSRR